MINYRKRTEEQWATHYELKELGVLNKERVLLSSELEQIQLQKNIRPFSNVNEWEKELEELEKREQEINARIEEINNHKLCKKYNKKVFSILGNDQYFMMFFERYLLDYDVEKIAEEWNVNKSTVQYNINRLLRYTYILVGGEE